MLNDLWLDRSVHKCNLLIEMLDLGVQVKHRQNAMNRLCNDHLFKLTLASFDSINAVVQFLTDISNDNTYHKRPSELFVVNKITHLRLGCHLYGLIAILGFKL